jgi:hypothetical protein
LISTVASSEDLALTTPKTSRNQVQYLKYNPMTNGLPELTIHLDYEINDEQIILGDSAISKDSFRIFMGTPASIDPALAKMSDLDHDEIILITAPYSLLKNDTQKSIEVFTDSGKTIWKYNFTKNDAEMSAKIYEVAKKNLTDNNAQVAVLATKLNLRELLLPMEKNRPEFRICLKQQDYDFFSEICTPFYKMVLPLGTLKQKIKIDSMENIVMGDDKNYPLKVSIAFTNDKSMKFFFKSKNQFSVSVKIKPTPNVQGLLDDYFQDTRSNEVVLVGHSLLPFENSVKTLQFYGKNLWLKNIGWLPIKTDLNDYWFGRLKPENTNLRFSSLGAIPLTYQFSFLKIPTDKQRIAIEATSPQSTYASQVKLTGIDPIDGKIEVKKDQTKITNTANGQFTWNFQLNQSGAETTQALTLKSETNSWIANHSLYRGWNSEFSLRMAGTASASLQLSLLAEASMNHWFEDMLSLSNPNWSVQRWGVSFKYFSPLKSFTSKSSKGSPVTIHLATLDLKYRFTPGLWERDETWGFILGTESAEINSIKANLGGAGFFWARSMPQFFDYIFNILPFMRFPKWVDLDFIYYSVPFKSSLMVGPKNYSMNFHGKILWTQGFFGEAGFGYKSNDFGDKELDKKTWYTSIYGTMGLGLNF